MILLIDNYDSFVHNLARYFQRLGWSTKVVRNDQISIAEIEALEPQAIVISPGPCSPLEAGISLEVVRQLHRQIPILGICLGHQTIAAAFGAKIVKAPAPMHGRTSLISHDNSSVFESLSSPMKVCRYHSLVVDRSSLPPEIRVTAETDDNVIMGIAHDNLPVVGLQFHPESILTETGYPLLSAFLERANLSAPLPNDVQPLSIDDELKVPPPDEFVEPDQPVTF